MQQNLFLGLFLICLMSCGKKTVTKDDYKLTNADYKYVHEVIDSGKYSPHFYLKAIIEGKNEDEKLKKIMSRMDIKNLTPAYCDGLVSSILKNTYHYKYKKETYEGSKTTKCFSYLEFKEFKGRKYFYQNVNLAEDNELFIWGIYNTKESENKLFTVVADSVGFQIYKFVMETINGIDMVAFYGPFECLLASIDGKMTQTIRYNTPENIKKTAIYKNCELIGDSLIECPAWWQKPGSSDQIPVSQRAFTSPLLYDDIDKDGALEGYWVMASMGKLIYSEVFEINEKGIKKSNQIPTNKIPKNESIMEILRISTIKRKVGVF